jgi:hypothetical protein
MTTYLEPTNPEEAQEICAELGLPANFFDSQLSAVKKFNPYHDSKGRFATGPDATMDTDMAKQADWLNEKAVLFGYKDADDMAEKNFEAFLSLSKVWRETHVYKGFQKLFKANPYHDEVGRFTTADNAAFVSSGGRWLSFKHSPEGVLSAIRDQLRKTQVSPNLLRQAVDRVAYRKDHNASETAAILDDPGAYWDLVQEEIESLTGMRVEPVRRHFGQSFYEGAFRYTDFADNDKGRLALAKEAVRTMGVGTDATVVMFNEDRKFELNGQEHLYGGWYQFWGQHGPEIAVKGTLPVRSTVRVLAHEVAHHKFRTTIDKAGPDGLSPMDTGLVSAELQKTLEETDGVTPYSRDWWKAFKEGKASVKQAINETLAEIATLSRAERLKMTSKEWRGLYDRMVKEYDALMGAK